MVSVATGMQERSVPMNGQVRRWQNTRCIVAVLVGALCLVLGASRPANALTPKSPEVKRAVEKAVTFLESEQGSDRRVGGQALVAMALLKSGKSPSHPRVQAAAAAVRQSLSTSNPKYGELYTPGLSLIFLVELESEQYRPEIEKLLRYLASAQKPHGGWGYPDKPTGDTSMTQYVVLGLWEASRSGFTVDLRMVERGLIWLLKVRDPSGGFGYQGVVSDSFKPVPQTRVAHGVSLAGLSSVYGCADLLGFYKSREEKDSPAPGLKKVKAADQNYKCSVDRSLIDTTTAAGARWIQQHFAPKISHWPYYYLYTLERYFSFRELAEGGKPKQLSNWYDLCAQHLIDTQAEDGSWHDTGKSEGSTACDTAWGALLLLRSMRKSIDRVRSFGTGTLVGGRGLPKDSELVKVKNGQVVSQAEASEIEKLLENMGEGDEEQYTKAIGALSELPSDEAKALISEQAGKLRALAGGTSADQRLAAVQALASAGSLDDVPTLIYVLTDPEPEIVLAARSGLRRISRKVFGFRMPDDFDESERLSAIRHWKEWYLALRPDAEFE